MADTTIGALSAQSRAPYQNVGLILGPALFALMMLFGANHEPEMGLSAWRVAAIGLWMAVWWATEAIPVPVTAFLPIVTFPIFGVADMREAAAPYANPIIYLYLGGFLIAVAVERWNLHKRIALAILTRTGTDGRKLVGGFMLTCGLLSMWIANTSTTMMLLPIALSVIAVIRDNVPNLSDKNRDHFQLAMMLGLAYSATIGGLATLVGTPPNALLAGFLKENYGMEISFAEWMMVGVPASLVMLPLTWVYLTGIAFPFRIAESAETKEYLAELQEDAGPMTSAEKRVAAIFGIVVFMWVMRRPFADMLGIEGLTDPGIAMVAALLFFLLPSGSDKQQQLLVWQDANRLPWGVLILFGGGLSLASAVSSSGLAHWLGESLTSLSVFGMASLIIASVLLVIFLTELTSNSATAAAFLPVMGAVAIEAGVSPLMLCVPVTLAASCAFMLPVATPPNAIVYSSGMVTIPQMSKAGVFLNLIGVCLFVVLSLWWVPLIFD